MADGSDNHEDSCPVVPVGSYDLTDLRIAVEGLPQQIKHVNQANVASAAVAPDTNASDIMMQLRKQLGQQSQIKALEAAYNKNANLEKIPEEEKLTSPETDGVVEAKKRELEPSV